MTALSLFFSSQASTSLTTANQIYITSGTPTTQENEVLIGTVSGWGEMYSQGNTGAFAGSGSIGSPSGHGFYLETSILNLSGQQIISGNWTGTIRSGLKTSGDTCTVTFTVRVYKYSSGTYTNIATLTSSSQSFSSASAISVSLPSTAGNAMSFSTGETLYVDVWAQITAAATLGTQQLRFNSLSTDTSGHTGSTSETLTSPGYQAGTTTRKDIIIRGRLSGVGYHDIKLRGRLSSLGTHDINLRGNVGNVVYKYITIRGRTFATANKDIITRGKISAGSYRDIIIRGNVTARNTIGGFTLYGNGSGTVQYDSFRVTTYPDPALCFAPVLPRLGTTSVIYNALLPTNTTLGIDTSIDGVNWADVTNSNGSTIPNIFSQPDPLIDGFNLNTSSSYTSTFRSGGAPSTWTFDTTNSRLIATGGTNSILTYNAISRADIDFFVDMDQSDAGGLVWRFIDQGNFYYLQINDSLSSVGTKNTVILQRVVSNTLTQLASASLSYTVGTPQDQYTVTFTRGTYHRFRVTMLTGVITVYFDGKQIITYTDSSPLGAGKMGLFNNGGTIGSRYYILWMVQVGDYVTGTPSGDIVTSKFSYTRQRLNSNDSSVSPQVLDVTTTAFNPQISPGTVIPNITYNYDYISKNLDDLAKQSNFSWFVDPYGYFVFRNTATVAAPWILQSSASGLVSSVDLEVDSDLGLEVSNDLYRNRQIITGAKDTITPSPAYFTGDGSTQSFTLGYELASAPTILLNGVAQTVGLKGTVGSNWYYALNDPVIEQNASGTALKSTDLLQVNYTGLYDIIVIVDNTTEQATHAAIEGGTGIVEAVEDHSGEGMLKAAAVTLASQLINRYAIAGRTLTFNTTRDGLAVGQTLTIHFPEHGVADGQFYINQIEIKLKKGANDTQVYTYKVTASELPRVSSWAKLIASGLLFT